VNPILLATLYTVINRCRSDHGLTERAGENKDSNQGCEMAKGLIAIILMLLIAVDSAQAGELRIIETEEGITAEYTGTAAESGDGSGMAGESDKTSANSNDADKIQQQAVREQSKIADSSKSKEEIPVNQKNYRLERKKQMKALRKSSISSPSSANLE
jgi:hypothetical protein